MNVAPGTPNSMRRRAISHEHSNSSLVLVQHLQASAAVGFLTWARVPVAPLHCTRRLAEAYATASAKRLHQDLLWGPSVRTQQAVDPPQALSEQVHGYDLSLCQSRDLDRPFIFHRRPSLIYSRLFLSSSHPQDVPALVASKDDLTRIATVGNARPTTGLGDYGYVAAPTFLVRLQKFDDIRSVLNEHTMLETKGGSGYDVVLLVSEHEMKISEGEVVEKRPHQRACLPCHVHARRIQAFHNRAESRVIVDR